MRKFVTLILTGVMLVGCGQQEVAEDSVSSNLQEAIYASLDAGDVQISFENIDEGVVARSYTQVISEHPEFFWVGNGYSYEVAEYGNNKTVTLIPVISTEMKAQKTVFDEKVDEIVRDAAMQENAFHQILYIHDYLVDHTVYDFDTYEIVSQAEVPDGVYPATTAYGCLVEGKAICSGYAAAFQVLVNRLGFDCGRVVGNKVSGESHEWNYIKLDDEYYFIDVTWDDPISADGMDLKSYSYFCITADELEGSHVISKGQDVPDCNGTKYNYHRYYGVYLDEYNADNIKSILENAEEPVLEIRFANSKICQKTKEELFDKASIFDMLEIQNISYTIDSSGCVIQINMGE